VILGLIAGTACDCADACFSMGGSPPGGREEVQENAHWRGIKSVFLSWKWVSKQEK